MYSWVPPFEGSTSSWRGVSSPQQAYSMPQRPHPILWWTTPQRFGSPSTIGILRGGIRSLYTTRLGARIHKGIGGSQESPLSHLGSKDPRVTSSQLSLPRIFVERANRCTKCNGKNTQSVQILLIEIQPKQLAREGFERKNKEKHQETLSIFPFSTRLASKALIVSPRSTRVLMIS